MQEVIFIDRIGSKQNMIEQVLDVPFQEILTKDNSIVTVAGVVFFQVLDSDGSSPWTNPS